MTIILQTIFDNKVTEAWKIKNTADHFVTWGNFNQ